MAAIPKRAGRLMLCSIALNAPECRRFTTRTVVAPSQPYQTVMRVSPTARDPRSRVPVASGVHTRRDEESDQ